MPQDVWRMQSVHSVAAAHAISAPVFTAASTISTAASTASTACTTVCARPHLL